MAWSTKRIEEDILHGKIASLALPPERIIASFDITERILGPKWISDIPGAGVFKALKILGMGQRLAAIENVASAGELLENVRKHNRSAEAELTAIYILRSSQPLTDLELYPSADDHTADFRIRNGNEDWTTVEVTSPNNSQEKERIHGILRKLTEALSNQKHQFALEVVFGREPSQSEIAVLCDRLPEFCVLDGPQQATLVGDLGYLFLNQAPVGHLVKHDPPGFEDKPMAGLMIVVGGGPDGKPLNQVSVRIPFADNRAEEILDYEARQLPRKGRGLVMMEVGSANGSFDSWSQVFERRFSRKIHTRVSGVCLFEAGLVGTDSGYNWFPHTQLVINPCAQLSLPTWIHEALARETV